jgi:hypothetical protein
MIRPLAIRLPKDLERSLKHPKSTPRRQHSLKAAGMTVCTSSMFFWNYSPTGQDADFGAAIIAASDRTLTDAGLGIGYEGSRFKGSTLATKQLVLVAGDITTHSAVLRLLTAELKPDRPTDTLQIANMVARLLREYRMREAAHQFLSPLNLDDNSFIAQQRTMEPSLVIEVAN